MTLRTARCLLVALVLALSAGCTAVSSIESAARALDVYELMPAARVPGGSRTSRSVAVEVPSSSAAVATDRILVKPDPLAVAYLPGARWVEPAPAHLQSLLIRSLDGSGRTGFVGASASGALPDYVLLTRLEAFQAEIEPRAQPPVRVVVAITLSVMRDIDGRIVASRRFERTATAANDSPATVVSAFNAAMAVILPEATAWAIASMAGGGA
jgi:cholesterol transport system auxiliary component